MIDDSRQYTIISVAKMLIGKITAAGETYMDNEVLENLRQVDYLMNEFASVLHSNMEIGERSYEGSVQDIGDKSRSILHGLKDWVDGA